MWSWHTSLLPKLKRDRFVPPLLGWVVLFWSKLICLNQSWLQNGQLLFPRFHSLNQTVFEIFSVGVSLRFECSVGTNPRKKIEKYQSNRDHVSLLIIGTSIFVRDELLCRECVFFVVSNGIATKAFCGKTVGAQKVPRTSTSLLAKKWCSGNSRLRPQAVLTSKCMHCMGVVVRRECHDLQRALL